jgi:hypothetical protein
MADFISDLAAKTGISPDLARKGVGVILALLKDKLPAGAFAQVQQAIPNANNLMAAADVPQETSGGILSKVGDVVSKIVGSGGAAELASRFTQLGFSPDQIKKFLPLVVEFLKNKLPADVAKQLSALTPPVAVAK